jgi:hypothetical protein
MGVTLATGNGRVLCADLRGSHKALQDSGRAYLRGLPVPVADKGGSGRLVRRRLVVYRLF